MEKTENKTETLNRLFKENGLLAEDIHRHQHYTIINRMGIEKIQAKNGVTVKYEAVVMERDFAVIKGTFSKEGVPDIETFGSASEKTSQNKYYAEMAEKRCLSRGVLKICKFYELGVFGEDEADDFKKKEEIKPDTTPGQKYTPKQDAPAGTTQPPKDTPEITASEQGESNIKYATTFQKNKIQELLNHPTITRQEKTKYLLAINSFSEEVADKKISNIEKVIKEREEKDFDS